MASIGVSIDEGDLELLELKARREGASVDSLVQAALGRLIAQARDEEARMVRDPLYRLAPAFGSRKGDLASEHDHYLYGLPRKR